MLRHYLIFPKWHMILLMTNRYLHSLHGQKVLYFYLIMIMYMKVMFTNAELPIYLWLYLQWLYYIPAWGLVTTPVICKLGRIQVERSNFCFPIHYPLPAMNNALDKTTQLIYILIPEGITILKVKQKLHEIQSHFKIDSPSLLTERDGTSPWWTTENLLRPCIQDIYACKHNKWKLLAVEVLFDWQYS